MRKNRKRGPGAERTGEILGALQEIEYHFANEGFSESIPQPESEAFELVESSETCETDELEDDARRRPDVFDAEEIEIAIDAFLSQLMHARIIEKPKHGPAPSMEDVFQDLMGNDEALIKAVQCFEKQVSGYFGWVSRDDMESAYRYLCDIKGSLVKHQSRVTE